MWVSVVLRIILKGGPLCSSMLIAVQTGKIKLTNIRRTKVCKEFTDFWPSYFCIRIPLVATWKTASVACSMIRNAFCCQGTDSSQRLNKGLYQQSKHTFSCYFDGTLYFFCGGYYISLFPPTLTNGILVVSVCFCNCLSMLTVFMMVKILTEPYS